MFSEHLILFHDKNSVIRNKIELFQPVKVVYVRKKDNCGLNVQLFLQACEFNTGIPDCGAVLGVYEVLSVASWMAQGGHQKLVLKEISTFVSGLNNRFFTRYEKHLSQSLTSKNRVLLVSMPHFYDGLCPVNWEPKESK